jgi:hypothetical protein
MTLRATARRTRKMTTMRTKMTFVEENEDGSKIEFFKSDKLGMINVEVSSLSGRFVRFVIDAQEMKKMVEVLE